MYWSSAPDSIASCLVLFVFFFVFGAELGTLTDFFTGFTAALSGLAEAAFGAATPGAAAFGAAACTTTGVAAGAFGAAAFRVRVVVGAGLPGACESGAEFGVGAGFASVVGLFMGLL